VKGLRKSFCFFLHEHCIRKPQRSLFTSGHIAFHLEIFAGVSVRDVTGSKRCDGILATDQGRFSGLAARIGAGANNFS
jgi:hypothetical protein